MSIKQFPGGIITQNPTAPTTAAAKGIWTLAQASDFVKQGIWPRSPGAPTIGTATATGATTATVAFTVPTDLGAGSITYLATSSPAGGSGTGSSSPVTVTGLTGSTSYTFVVQGVTPGGTGPASAASNLITTSPPAAYFIGYTVCDNNTLGNVSSIDSDGNMYVIGSTKTSASSAMQVLKFNNQGVLQWQKEIGASDDRGLAVTTDSSGNVYVCGRTFVSGVPNFLTIKLDSSGASQWQKALSNVIFVTDVKIDSGNNVIVVGAGTSDNTQIAKYNSSGTLQWQKQLQQASYILGENEVAVDSSDNIYISGTMIEGGYFYSIVAKYNSSGTLQWQNKFGGSSKNQYGNSIATDASGNVVICGYTDFTGTAEFLIYKLNSSGTLQWQRTFGDVYDQGYGIATDSSDNVYIIGEGYYASNNFTFAKFNSSGTIQLQRQLGGGLSDLGRSIRVASDGAIYICGYTQSGYKGFMYARLPNDGSLTGTYTVGAQSISYAASSFTVTTPSLTNSTSTKADTTTTFTDSSTSRTVANSVLTPEVTTI